MAKKLTLEQALELVLAEELSSAPESFFSEEEAHFEDDIDPYEDMHTENGKEHHYGPQRPSTSQEGTQPLPPSSQTPCTSADSSDTDVDQEYLPQERGRGRGYDSRAHVRGCKSRSRARSRGPSGRGQESSATAQPAWKTEEEIDSLPQPCPRFLPKRNPGVQPPLSPEHTPSPMELFKLYFDKKTIQILCDNTNKNAQKNIAAGKKFSWTPLTPEELCKFLGLVFYMGVLKLPKISDMWRDKSFFHVPGPAKVMSRDRFLFISWNLHMSDPEEDALNDRRKGTEDYDRLHRLRPLYDSLRVACKGVYHPHQNLAVDERMVATKAKIGIKQYIKNKPKKWGIKLFVLADSNGYTVDFTIYTGKAKTVSGRGLSFDAVMSLVKKSFLGSGYHIYCDNFYTSPALFQHLWELGFGACGTYREGRVGVPKTKLNALKKNSKRGSIRWIRDGQLLFQKWMDNREVSVCSTVHTASSDTVMRGRKTSDGYVREAVPWPTVRDYNNFMGGVDLSDQLIGYYSTWRKSAKWYKTIFYHFLDIAATNSHILHKQLCAIRGEQPMSHQAFHELLSAELCGVTLDLPDTARVRVQCHHTPVAIAMDVDPSKKATEGQRKCKLCGKKTPFHCKACRVPLCVIVDRNCHDQFHNSLSPCS